jgi:hypothetical protein
VANEGEWLGARAGQLKPLDSRRWLVTSDKSSHWSMRSERLWRTLDSDRLGQRADAAFGLRSVVLETTMISREESEGVAHGARTDTTWATGCRVPVGPMGQLAPDNATESLLGALSRLPCPASATPSGHLPPCFCFSKRASSYGIGLCGEPQEEGHRHGKGCFQHRRG